MARSQYVIYSQQMQCIECGTIFEIIEQELIQCPICLMTYANSDDTFIEDGLPLSDVMRIMSEGSNG